MRTHRITNTKYLELARKVVQRQSSGTTSREPELPQKIIGDRGVKRIYFEDEYEVGFQDSDRRFWHFDKTEKTLTELIPGRPDSDESIPQEVWEAFGQLLGLLISRKQSHSEFENQ